MARPGTADSSKPATLRFCRKCHNPDSAERDAATRANLVERLAAMIDDSDRLSPTRRSELRGVISTKPGLNRFLRVTPGGLLRVDVAAVTVDAKLDGKYLLRTCDPPSRRRTSRWATSSCWKSNAAGWT